MSISTKPSVTGMSPTSGPSIGGTAVTITGTQFQDLLNPVASVTFGTNPAVPAQYFTEDSPTQLTAVAPSGTVGQSVSVTVTWQDGTSDASPSSFTFFSSLTIQVMMTLAGLAPTGATERPSGESCADQAQRIFSGINTQLQNSSLATAAEWTVRFIELTQDRANLAYIAQNTSISPDQPQQYAVCLRGTVAGDIPEDMDVTPPLLPFAAGGAPPSGAPGNISTGAMLAFTEIVNGTTLMQDLTSLISGQTQAPTVYVTGHSLGGCMATTVSLFLAAQTWNPTPSFEVYTFAAPTAGDATFAQWFVDQLPTATCVWNQYDVVPQAWWNLTGGIAHKPPAPETAEWFFPGQGGGATLQAEVVALVAKIAGKASTSTIANPYTQPQTQQQLVLNVNFSSEYQQPPAGSITTMDDWTHELGQQHANNTYLGLLGATLLPPLTPTITSLSANSGTAAGGTSITINGSNFTQDFCGVDFGVVAGVSLAFVNANQLTVTTPPGVGIVNIMVTTPFGNSSPPSTPAALSQFTYT